MAMALRQTPDGQPLKTFATATSVKPPVPTAPKPATPNQLPGSATPPTANITPVAPIQPINLLPAPGTPQINAPAPGTPQIGTPLSQFGPDKNLIGTQINPTTDPRLGAAQGATDQFLRQLQSTPDREALAKQAFQNIESSIADQRKLGIQDIGRSAAKFGRIGSGKVTTDLGNLENQLDINRNRALNELSYSTAGQKLSDILGSLGATSSLEGQRFSQGATGRDELRGEREYQRGMSEQAKQDAISQAMGEQGYFQQGLGNQLSLTDLLGGYGFGSGENYGPAMALSQLLGNQATAGMMGLNQMFNAQAQNQQQGQSGGLSLQNLLGGLGSGLGKVGSWIGGLFG